MKIPFTHLSEEFVYTIIAGISGGLINMYMANKELSREKVGVLKLVMAIIFGLSGALFIAPIIVDYFDIDGRMIHGITFIVSILTELILLSFINVMTLLVKNPWIILNIFTRIQYESKESDMKIYDKDENRDHDNPYD